MIKTNLSFFVYFFVLTFACANAQTQTILTEQSCLEVLSLNSKAETKTQRFRANDAVATGRAVERLTEAGILYSVFFLSSLENSKPRALSAGLDFEFRTPDQIKALNAEQLDQLSMVLLEEIKSGIDNSTNFDASLPDYTISRARDTLLSLSDAEILDAIGETLMVVGEAGFIDREDLISKAFKKTKKIALAELGLSTVGLAVAGAAAGLSYESGPYYTYSLWSEMPEAIPFWLVVKAGALGLSDSARRFYYKSRLAIKSVDQNLAERHKKIDLVHSPDASIFYVPQDLSAKLTEYKDVVDSIVLDFEAAQSESSSPVGRTEVTDQNFLAYSSDVVDLQAEISRVFFDGFIKWLDVYDRNKGIIKERFEQLEVGEIKSKESHQKVVAFLDKSLTEAVGHIILTRKLVSDLLRVLGVELDELRRFDTESIDQTALLSYNSRLDSVAVTHISLGQFYLQLEQTHAHINALNSHVEALRNAETLAITNHLGVSSDLENSLNSSRFPISDAIKAMEKFEESVGGQMGLMSVY